MARAPSADLVAVEEDIRQAIGQAVSAVPPASRVGDEVVIPPRRHLVQARVAYAVLPAGGQAACIPERR
jgi:hypothetical protein